MQSPAIFKVLVVCTGNICRSPVAERLLHAQLEAAGIPALIVSAGTQSMVGYGMTPEAAQLAQRYGAEQSGHRSQQLTEQHIADSDLVLTATRDHRSAVVSLHPRASRYTYTLNQLARLLPAVLEPGAQYQQLETDETRRPDTAETLRALLAEVSTTRGYSPPPAHPDDDDIEDPYRQSVDVYARVGDVLNASVTTITSAFVAAVGRS
ncbi:low molecular weight phosphatase family protein [Cryobacterium lactosi]|uniref:arsenate reductase/protein-tyrosine-phosphatase family protein n=1 Tax=Cryobacterium lactosi TaxID=1259202 RepID=UPI00141A9994|nr:low molecular weight phosphatase family protein [Cryobacterium lactosi]